MTTIFEEIPILLNIAINTVGLANSSECPKLSKSDIKSVVEEAKVVSIDSGEKCGGV